MRISQKRLRSILRTEYPREVKGKKWGISIALAKHLEKKYKAKFKESETKKQTGARKELESA